MHAHSVVDGQDANGIHRLVPALGVDGVMGEPARARHMRPRQRPGPPHARLVVMQHRRAHQCRLDMLLDRYEHVRRLLHPAHQGSPREPHPEQIGEQLLHATQRQMLLLDQVDRQRPHVRAVLGSAGDPGGKRAAADVRAVRATCMQRLMFAHH